MADDDTNPLACTLDENERPDRIDHVTDRLAPAYRRVESNADGLTVVFDGTGETLRAVASFVTNELERCSFAVYSIETRPPFDETRLQISGPNGTSELFREGLLPRLRS